MKYCIDRIEGDIAILEELTTKEIIEVNINQLPPNIKETNIVTLINDTYILDEVEEEQRRNSIQSRFNKLRKKRSE